MDLRPVASAGDQRQPQVIAIAVPILLRADAQVELLRDRAANDIDRG
jgi:hypothetical protein